MARATVAALLILTIGFFFTAHCGEEAVSCDRTSNCSGDSTPPWGTEQACSHRLAGQCGPYWSDYMGCEQSHQQCLASGATDQNTVDSICHLQHEIYLQCCEGPDSGTDPKGCSP